MRSLFLVLGFVALGAWGCVGPSSEVESSTTKIEKVETAAKRLLDKETLNQANFTQVWATETSLGPIEQIWFLGGNLYITSPDSRGNYTLRKISGESGLTAWTHPLAEKLKYAPSLYNYENEVQRTPELFIVEDDSIVRLDDNAGYPMVPMIETGVAVSTPVTATREHVFVGSWNNRVTGFRKSDGVREWSYLTGGSVVAAPEVGDLDLYVGSEDGTVTRLNAGVGYKSDTSWDFETGGRITATPLFFRDRIYTGSYDYKVYCLDEFKGFKRWSYVADAPIGQRIVPFKETLFAVSERTSLSGEVTTKLIALKATDGDFLWERDGIARVVAADSLYCYALDQEETLHSIRHSDGESDRTLDLSQFDYVLGQDAEKGIKRDHWGLFFVATAEGYLQAIKPSKR